MKDRSVHRRQSLLAVIVAVLIISAGAVVLGPRLRGVLERGFRDRGEKPGHDTKGSGSSASPDAGAFLASMEEVDRSSVLLRADRGGVLASPGGAVHLDVPPFALSDDTQVDLVRYAVTEEDGGPGAFAYDLQPDGLELQRPARLRMAVPLGFAPEELEISVFDLAGSRWRSEPDQSVIEGGDALTARLRHFSLRRVRIRPGMEYPFDPHHGRATFYLESDAGNSYERYVEGRWQAVRRRTPSYRDLMRMGRLGRMNLITTGRLRAVTGARPTPVVFLDTRRTVALPPGAAEAVTGWVRIRRLDRDGRPTGHQVVAHVNDYGPGAAPRHAGVIADLSRATMEALGLRWGEDFGLAEDNPNLAWIKLADASGTPPLRYLPVAVEAYRAQPARAPTCRLW